MPTYLQHAFIAVEDARFYTHNGVDIKLIIGCVRVEPVLLLHARAGSDHHPAAD